MAWAKKITCSLRVHTYYGGPLTGLPVFEVGTQGEKDREYKSSQIVKSVESAKERFSLKYLVVEINPHVINSENVQGIDDVIQTLVERGATVVGHGDGQVRPAWWTRCNYRVVHLTQVQWLGMPVQEIRFYPSETLEEPDLNAEVHKNTHCYVVSGGTNKKNIETFLQGAKHVWRVLPPIEDVSFDV